MSHCLQERDEAPREVHKKLAVVLRKLESLRCIERDLEECVLVARADIAVQTLLRKEVLE